MISIVVAGALGNKPQNGGNAWVILSWLLGLKRLGFEVYFIEQIADDAAYGGLASSVNVSYAKSVLSQYGFGHRSVMLNGDGSQIEGLSWPEVIEVAESATLLVNISGHLRLPALLNRFRRKVYLDLDPGYTQFWLADGLDRSNLAGHDAFFTVGENIGTSTCDLPTGGLEWHAVRPPSLRDEWPMTDSSDERRFTTVASWRGAYGRVESGGRTFGQKAHEFRKLADTPRLAPEHCFEIALDIDPGDATDASLLQSRGWRLTSPECATGTPSAFRSYVQRSGGELSPAQGIYVETNSGWFSDRTVRYLASGKPAIVQDTGFSRHLPVGEGLFAYRCEDDILAALNHIEGNYRTHARAARRVAETYFDSDAVLTRFLEQAGAT